MQTIRMVCRLNGRLRFGAAVPHRLERRRVALHPNDTPVLHYGDNAAFHFAAAATPCSDTLDVTSHRLIDGIVSNSQTRLSQRGDAERRACHDRDFDEIPSRHMQFTHTLLLIFDPAHDDPIKEIASSFSMKSNSKIGK